jgi:hypothetical protein
MTPTRYGSSFPSSSTSGNLQGNVPRECAQPIKSSGPPPPYSPRAATPTNGERPPKSPEQQAAADEFGLTAPPVSPKPAPASPRRVFTPVIPSHPLPESPTPPPPQEEQQSHGGNSGRNGEPSGTDGPPPGASPLSHPCIVFLLGGEAGLHQFDTTRDACGCVGCCDRGG